MIAEATTAPLYAPLSDKIGRRPIIVVLLVFWSVGGLGFGLCQSVWSAVLMRMWCEWILREVVNSLLTEVGMLAGCGVLSRTMLGEMCDKSNRIQGFAIFTPALTVGMTLGWVWKAETLR